MKKAGMLVTAVLVIFVIVSFGFQESAYAIDDITFTKMIHKYSETMGNYADALLSKNWKNAKKTAQSLLMQAEEFENMGKKEGNKDWLTRTPLLISHSKELIETAEEQDAEEAFVVASGMYMHFQLFQAMNPVWLINYVGKDIEKLAIALEKRDVKAAMKPAETLCTGGSNMAISGAMLKGKFVNTRWIKDAYKMNVSGDELQEAVVEGNWDKAEKLLAEARVIHKKIKTSLKR